MIWKPNVTVAAVIEQDGRFLLVEEETEDGLRFNQPAGHLECREALVDAVVREALEETGYHFVPRFLVGIYSWRNEAKDVTYLRFAFGGDIAGHEPDRRLDDGIVAARWLTPEEIRAMRRYVHYTHVSLIELVKVSRYLYLRIRKFAQAHVIVRDGDDRLVNRL